MCRVKRAGGRSIGVALAVAVLLLSGCRRSAETPAGTTPDPADSGPGDPADPKVVVLGTAAAVHPDAWGLRLEERAGVFASAGQDDYVRLWSLETGELLAYMRAEVESLAFVPGTADLLVSLRREGAAILRREGRALQSRRLDGCPAPVAQAVVWPDADHATCLTRDGAVTVSIETGKLVRRLSEDRGRAMVGSPGGTLTVRHDHRIVQWTSGEAAPASHTHAGSGSRMATDAAGRVVALWPTATVATGPSFEIWHLDAPKVLNMAVSANGAQVATGGQVEVQVQIDQTGPQPKAIPVVPDAHEPVRIWNVQRRKVVRELGDHGLFVRGLEFSADGRRLLSTGQKDDLVHLWDLDTGREVDRPHPGHVARVGHVGVSRNGQTIISGSRRMVAAWDPSTGTVAKTRAFETKFEDLVRNLASASAGDTVVLARDRRVEIFADGISGEPRVVDPGFDVVHLSVDATGARMVLAGTDGPIELWDVSKGRKMQEFRRVPEPTSSVTRRVEAVQIAPDGGSVVVASWPNLWVFAVGRDEPLARLDESSKNRIAIADIAVSSGAEVIAAAGQSDEGPPLVVYQRTGRRITRHDPVGVSGDSYCVAAHPDGTRVAFGQHENVVVFTIEGETVQHAATLPAHTGDVNDLAFLPGTPRRLVSASDDTTLRLWPVP